MANPVGYFEVIGRDHDALAAFYGDLFGWEISNAGPGGYSFARPGEGISGGIGGSPDGRASYQTFYVQVEDLEAALQRAEELGGKTTMAPTEVGHGTRAALFEDPEGHTIGLVSTDASG